MAKNVKGFQIPLCVIVYLIRIFLLETHLPCNSLMYT